MAAHQLSKMGFLQFKNPFIASYYTTHSPRLLQRNIDYHTAYVLYMYIQGGGVKDICNFVLYNSLLDFCMVFMRYFLNDFDKYSNFLYIHIFLKKN